MAVAIAALFVLCLLNPVEFSHQDTIPNKNDTTYTYDVAESSEWQVVYFGPSSTQVSSAIYSVSLNRDVYLTSNQEVSSTRDKSYAVPTTFSHFPPLPPTVTMSESTTFTTSTKSYNSVYEALTTHTVFASSSIAVSATPTAAPTGRTPTTIDYKLIICVVVPLFTVIVFVIVVAMVLCIRRYRKLRRYRQHLVPLTDMDGSDDSDDEDEISDKEPVFMVSSINSSARPILSFEDEND